MSGFWDFACRRLDYRGAGGSSGVFGVVSTGNNCGEENEEGLSEGREEVWARLVGCIRSQDCDLGRGIWYGRGCWGKSSWRKVCCGGGQVFVERNDSPFVGEVVEVELVVGLYRGWMLWTTILRGAVEEVVEEVVEVMAVMKLAEVEVEFQKMNQRDLPYDEMALSTSFWRLLLHCLSSSSGSWLSPLVYPGLSF